jgi:DNA polymerase
MAIIYIDFETYYDKDYSLRNMSTEAYIRDPRFAVHGVALAVDDATPLWVSGDKVAPALHHLHALHPDATWVAHNAQFDMAILSWHYGIRPAWILDTLSMARLVNPHGKHSLAALAQEYTLGAKGDALAKTLGVRTLTPALMQELADYCVQDVALLCGLSAALKDALTARLSVERYAREMQLIDLTVRLFTEPVLELDMGSLESSMEALGADRDALIAASGLTESVLMSNPQFTAALAAIGVDAPASLSKTDPDMLSLRSHPRAAPIIRARLAAKSVSELRRTERFLDVAARGTLPVPLKYFGAHTGRWSGADGINVQNLNRGSALRKSILAPEGHMLVVVDSSQIEARVLAWLADEVSLLDAFAEGKDVYVEFARAIWPGDEISAEKRFVAKTCVLGLGYSVGAAKLHEQIVLKQPSVTLEEAREFVAVYRMTYKGIVRLWRVADMALRCMMSGQQAQIVRGMTTEHNALQLPSGRWLQYPDLRMVSGGFEYGQGASTRRLYGGALVENITQAIARDIVADQMLALSKRYKVVMMTHDEIVLSVPEEDADEAFTTAKTIMRLAPQYVRGLPLDCSGGYAREYSK